MRRCRWRFASMRQRRCCRTRDRCNREATREVEASPFDGGDEPGLPHHRRADAGGKAQRELGRDDADHQGRRQPADGHPHGAAFTGQPTGRDDRLNPPSGAVIWGTRWGCAALDFATALKVPRPARDGSTAQGRKRGWRSRMACSGTAAGVRRPDTRRPPARQHGAGRVGRKKQREAEPPFRFWTRLPLSSARPARTCACPPAAHARRRRA